MEIVWILAVVYSDNIYVHSSFNMIDLNVFMYQNLKVQFQHQMALFVVPFIERLIIFIDVITTCNVTPIKLSNGTYLASYSIQV